VTWAGIGLIKICSPIWYAVTCLIDLEQRDYENLKKKKEIPTSREVYTVLAPFCGNPSVPQPSGV
jgi:hypothetical protein